MFYKQCLSLLVLSLIFFKHTTVEGLIDPVTGTFAIGAFIAGYFFKKSNYSYSFPFFDTCPRIIDIDGKVDFNCTIFLI